jgi:hypothetical protein
LIAAMGCGGSSSNSGNPSNPVNPVAQSKTFTVTLSPANETPPCAKAGADATGTATITIPSDDSSVSVDVTYSGLSGPATAAHIHSGTAAAAGPIVLPFSGSLASPINVTLTAANYVAAAGAPPDFPTFVAALKTGGAGYVNVHTAACPAGEIRAEIE